MNHEPTLAKVQLTDGLGPTRQQVNAWMADAGWQNSAIRQADLDKVERVARAAVAAERERCALQGEPVAWYDGAKFYSSQEAASMDCADMAGLKPLYAVNAGPNV